MQGDLTLVVGNVIRFGPSLGLSKTLSKMLIYGGTGAGNVGGTDIHYWNGSAFVAGLILNNNANVLINTTTDAGYKLDVNGTGRFSGKLTVTADATNEQLLIQRASNTNAQLIIGYHSDGYGRIQAVEQNVAFRPLSLNQSGGNVLIGTITDAGYKLAVNGNAYTDKLFTGTQGVNLSGYGALSQTISGQMTILGHNLAASNSVANQVDVMNSGWYSSMMKIYYSDGITFHTSTTVYSAGSVYPYNTNERMRIDLNGNVGIGTNSPISKLHVNGDMRTVLTSGVGGDTLIAAINGVSNGYIINVDTSNNITHTWHTGGNIPSVRITSGGNVLIGTTTDAGYKLDVNGTAFFRGKTGISKSISDYAFTVVNTDSSGYGMYIQAGSTNNAIDVFNSSGTTQLFKLTGAGAATFSGNTTGAIASFTNTNTAGTGNGILVDVNSQSGTDNYVMNLISNGTSRMYVREDGNVGIGTTSPAVKLDVNGDIKTGNLNSGTTAKAFKIGTVTSGTVTLVNQLEIEIDSTTYFIPCSVGTIY